MSSESPTPSEAEAGAEEARAELIGTLNQLRENLKPANVVEEVMTNAKVSASAITDQVWDVARKNPFPALLIGAGAAMILGLGGKAAVNRRAGPTPRRWQATPPPTRTSLPDTGPGGRVYGRTTAAPSSGAQAFKSSPATGASMTNLSRDQLTKTISKVLEEQPLVLAAIGVAVGAAIGAAIPQTETENSLMGQASGSVREAAQGIVQDQVSQLKAAASHAVDDIKQTVADHGINSDNLSGLVQEVGSKAKAATSEATRSLDPTAKSAS